MAQVKDSIAIGSSPEKVHSYVATVDKWPLWFAALGRVNSAEGDGAPGTVLQQTYSLVGKNIDFVTTVTENGPKAAGGYSWRSERGGELPGGLSLDFDPEGKSTLVSGELEYELPGGILGKAADHLGARAAMEHSLHHALQTLKELAEEGWLLGMDKKQEEWPEPCDDEHRPQAT
jgi:coenzyme Q-binding protein COQ10